MVRSCMTAVWDEVVEYEVIKLGIQCNAMFYSLCNLYLSLVQSAGVEEVFFLIKEIFIVCFVCTTWNIVSYLL